MPADNRPRKIPFVPQLLFERLARKHQKYLIRTANWTGGWREAEEALRKLNAELEQCEISAYKSMMDTTKDKDMVTCNLALTILDQEVEHEEDLQSLLEDLELMVGRGMSGVKKSAKRR